MTLSDSVSTAMAGGASVGDDLHAWAEAVAMQLHQRMAIADQITLSDSAALLYSYNQRVSGQMLWTDALSTTLGHRVRAVGDLNSWIDLIAVSLVSISVITRSVGDDLDAWADAVATSLSSLVDLIRLVNDGWSVPVLAGEASRTSALQLGAFLKSLATSGQFSKGGLSSGSFVSPGLDTEEWIN